MFRFLLLVACLFCAGCEPKTLEPQVQPPADVLKVSSETVVGHSSLYAHCESSGDHGGTCRPVSDLLEQKP